VTSETTTFAALSRKWQTVLAAVAEREAREAQVVVMQWTPRFQELLMRQREVMKAGLWTRGGRTSSGSCGWNEPRSATQG
jgi:hypothetical protein